MLKELMFILVESVLPSVTSARGRYLSTYKVKTILDRLIVKKQLQCRKPGSHPWDRKIPKEATGNPLQYSCLENSIDRGAWLATVHGVAKSQT